MRREEIYMNYEQGALINGGLQAIVAINFSMLIASSSASKGNTL